MDVVPPLTLPALNDAKIIILRNLKQEVLAVDTELSRLRGKRENDARLIQKYEWVSKLNANG